MTSTMVAPRTTADGHSTRQPFPEVTCPPPGSAAPIPQQPPAVAAGQARHDWTDWQPIFDPGVDEQLHERFCPTCGADEIGVGDQLGVDDPRMGERP